MTHEMKLKAEPFYKIKNRLKTVELRLYDEKRKRIAVGDEIIFTLWGTEESVRCKVICLDVFKSFEELYSTLSLTDCGYTGAELASASPRDMEKYYDLEEIKKYGAVGIKIKLI